MKVFSHFKVYSDFDLFCKCLFICRCQPQELDSCLKLKKEKYVELESLTERKGFFGAAFLFFLSMLLSKVKIYLEKNCSIF